MIAAILISGVCVIAVLLTSGIAYQRRGLQQDRRTHLPPGRLVTVGNRRLHLYETGSGQPAVVFESGLASSSLSWYPVQQIAARTTHAISYDRAGIGWSDEGVRPRTLSGMVEDLATVLNVSEIRPPYIFVGHSFGALLVRAYASLRTDEVAGLVFVDPVSLDLWADCSKENERRLRLGAKLSRRGVFLANVGVVRFALAALASGKTRLPQVVANASARKAIGTMSRLTGVVQKLPPSLRPFVQSHWSHAKSFRSMADYLDMLPQCAAAVRSMELPPNVPLTVLSASTASKQELAERERWVHASTRGHHVQIPESTHWVHLEHPEKVAAAILTMLASVRQGSDPDPTH